MIVYSISYSISVYNWILDWKVPDNEMIFIVYFLLKQYCRFVDELLILLLD